MRTTSGACTLTAKQVGHGEPVEIRQLDVEQHDVGAQPLHFVERVVSAGSLADNVETFRLQQRAGSIAERLMVVNNQHGRAHHTQSSQTAGPSASWPPTSRSRAMWIGSVTESPTVHSGDG